MEQKRLLMDLDISMRSGSCPYTVTFYGALFREVSVKMAYHICHTNRCNKLNFTNRAVD
jgi:hypothetical protein